MKSLSFHSIIVTVHLAPVLILKEKKTFFNLWELKGHCPYSTHTPTSMSPKGLLTRSRPQGANITDKLGAHMQKQCCANRRRCQGLFGCELKHACSSIPRQYSSSPQASSLVQSCCFAVWGALGFLGVFPVVQQEACGAPVCGGFGNAEALGAWSSDGAWKGWIFSLAKWRRRRSRKTERGKHLERRPSDMKAADAEFPWGYTDAET